MCLHACTRVLDCACACLCVTFACIHCKLYNLLLTLKELAFSDSKLKQLDVNIRTAQIRISFTNESIVDLLIIDTKIKNKRNVYKR